MGKEVDNDSYKRLSSLKSDKTEYKKIWKQGVGVADPINASLDKSQFLPASAIGGISVYARNDKICLDNTLSARLSIAQQSLMPILRGRLFGVVAHQGIVYEDEKDKDKE